MPTPASGKNHKKRKSAVRELPHGTFACQKTPILPYKDCRGEHCSPASVSKNLPLRGRCPEGAEGENLAITRNISGSRTVLSPTACGRSPLAEGAKGGKHLFRQSGASTTRPYNALFEYRLTPTARSASGAARPGWRQTRRRCPGYRF